MDWGRAKTVLIISFLSLNILLAYQLWVNRWSQAAGISSDRLIEETNRILAAKGIRLLSDIPKDTPTLSSISVHWGEEYQPLKSVELSTPIPVSLLLDSASTRDLGTWLGLEHFGEYELDAAASSQDVYVFYQMADGLPMFDVTLQFYADQNEIIGYKQAYVEVKSSEEPKERETQKIISAYTAIRSLAENYLKEGAVITDVRLGYHGQLFDSEDQTFVPYWRVLISDGEPYYVHAFTGAVEGLPPIQP